MMVKQAVEWYVPTGVGDGTRRKRDVEPTLVDFLTAKIGDYWRDPWDYLARTLPQPRKSVRRGPRPSR